MMECEVRLRSRHLKKTHDRRVGTDTTLKSDLIGAELHHVAEELFPICRSITGDGVRQTLNVLSHRFRPFEVFEVPSGTQCFDWTIPDEWNIRGARLIGPDGSTVVDFQ